MTASKILEKAKTLIENGWTQRVYARSESGSPVNWDRADARCFCTMGALHAAVWADWTKQCSARVATNRAKEAIQLFADANEMATHDIVDWNDAPTRRQADVISAFDRAIEYAHAIEETKGEK